jgi:hypothetical protein
VITATLGQVDWEHLESDTRYLTHNIHRYSGKFIPQIARQAIDICSRPGELVLDPYCGSGTTVLEAALTGRRALGVDLSPLAVLIARVKVTPVEESQLRALLAAVRTAVRSLQGQPGLPTSDDLDVAPVDDDPRLTDPWFTKWFAPQRLRELVSLDRMVNSIESEETRNIALVALSDVLRRTSFANSSYPNVMFDKRKTTPPTVYPIFLSRLAEICEAVNRLGQALPRDARALVLRGDARRLPLGDGAVAAVVTHPPYIGSIPYAEYGLLSLKWLGHDPKSLDRRLTGGVRQSRDVVQRFEDGYSDMLSEVARVLRQAGLAFLMVGSPTVRGEVIDLPTMSITLAEKHGLELVDQHHRRGGNRRANKMVGEELLLFRKS